MAANITRTILESFINCSYKGYLQLCGEKGVESDYARCQAKIRDEVRSRIRDDLAARCDNVVQDGSVDNVSLKSGASVMIGPLFEGDLYELRFDGLQLAEVPVAPGSFCYVPMLICEGRTVRKEERVLLECFGLLIARIQGHIPSFGFVSHGKDCKTTKVRLGTHRREAERFLRSLERLTREMAAPVLILNEHCHACEFRRQCQEQAMREDNLSLLRGIGRKEIKALNRKGILTVGQLAHTFRPRRKPKRAPPGRNKRYHSLQAMAVRDKRIYVLGSPTVPSSPTTVYLDFEGLPDDGYIYLIGLIVVKEGREERHSLWANNRAEETVIFEHFLDLLVGEKDYDVFCYGSFEKNVLSRLARATERKEIASTVHSHLVNVLSIIYAHVYFPTYSNGLKDVARCIGFSWSEDDATGLQSVAWRMQWESGHDAALKQRLITYNMEDCLALRKVTASLCEIAGPCREVKEPLKVGDTMVPVWQVQDIDKLSRDRKWGPVNFAQADFAFVNKCAYFDYQQERVFVRSSKVLRRNKAKRAKTSNRRLRISQRVSVSAKRCPACMSKEVRRVSKPVKTSVRKPRVKRAFDLVFSEGGIKRRIIECRTSLHQCRACKHVFVPDRHARLAKHFHGLQSWAMFQHVFYGFSLEKISGMLREFFGLQVQDNEVHLFKELMAIYYRRTYRGLLGKLLAGNLLHVDETEIKLKRTKGYVWVFTNLEDVVFLFRPDRETDFLHRLLKDFKGVLVSDFYAGYDSLQCPQQKCIIHLIRDMNQELLNNPYDEELRTITQPFGKLLQEIVASVDAYGLKRRALQRHVHEVRRFFSDLDVQSFCSDAAASLQQRLLKYQNKLFTFIEHDGVPWNNNNAENAIKRFAFYRENVVGTLEERGLAHYLLLLSLCQTCRYKSVSFLKFLLSRQRDVDAFALDGRRFPAEDSIEVDPPGFMSPFLRKKYREAKGRSPQEPIRHRGEAAAKDREKE